MREREKESVCVRVCVSVRVCVCKTVKDAFFSMEGVLVPATVTDQGVRKQPLLHGREYLPRVCEP